MIPSYADGNEVRKAVSTTARARTPFLVWRPPGRRALAVLAGAAVAVGAAVVLVLVAGAEGEGRPDALMAPNGYQSPVQYPVYQQAQQRQSTLRTIAEARLGDTAGLQQLAQSAPSPDPRVHVGNHFGFGFIGGVSWLVIILTIVFLFFILVTVCAKKDSWVRALAYTFVSTPCPAAVPRFNRLPSSLLAIGPCVHACAPPLCRRRWWLSTRANGYTSMLSRCAPANDAHIADIAGPNWRVPLRPRGAMNTHARMYAWAGAHGFDGVHGVVASGA